MNNLTKLLSHMAVTMQDILTKSVQNEKYFPNIANDVRERLNSATIACYAEMIAVEKQAETSLLPLHPNAPWYFPLTNTEDKTVTIPISHNISQCDNRLWDKKGEEITNFVVLDDRVLVKKTNGCSEVEFTIKAANGFRRKLCLPIAEFREGSWYRNFQGLTCHNPKRFREYLEIMCGDILTQEKIKVQSEGWHKDEQGYWRMITHHGEVTDSSYSVEVEEDGSRIYPVSRLDKAYLAKCFWDMRSLTKSNAALIIISYIILSAIYTFFDTAGVVPKFILGILGPRSSRKTSLAMVMANLYKRGASMSPSLTFKTATPSGIEQRLRKFKDSIMIVDDLMPTTDKTLQRRIESTLEHICRLFGDASETARNTDFFSKERAEKIQYRASGLCMFTGEYFSGVASSRSRCVTLKISPDTVDNEILSFYQDNLDILPGFLWNFMIYVEKNQSTLFQYIKENVSQVRREFQHTYDVARFAEYQAQLETAMGIFFAYLSDLRLVSVEVLEHKFQIFREEVMHVLLENQREMTESDPLNQIKRTIQNFCEEYPHMISNLKSNCPQKANLYVNEDYFYVHPQWLFAAISEYVKVRGEVSAIIDISYLKTVLESNGFLIRKKDGNVNRYTVKLPNSAQISDHRRFLCISKNILDSEPD